jgi:preprotein translocase subunit SecG
VTIPLIAAFGQTIFMLLLGGMAIFLILLVLVQRGRGGGLAGALSGVGGSSAFGAKAGDVFTKITIGTATIWIILCIAAAKTTPSNQTRVDVGANIPAASSPAISSVSEETDEAASEGESAPAEPVGDTEPAGGSESESSEETP